MSVAVKELCNDGGVLRLEKRRYEFFPDKAFEKYCCISNNDNGMKRILMPFEDGADIVVEGNGAELIFNGHLMPGMLTGCRRITLRNFSVDYVRPFHSEADVLAVSGNQVRLRIDPHSYPFHIRNDRLFFQGHGWCSDRLQSILIYDPETADIQTGTGDWYVFYNQLRAAKEEEDIVTLDWGDFPPPYALSPGKRLVIAMEGRETPCFAVSGCEDIRFEDITVYHSYAMAFLFQDCKNPWLNRCRVIPPEGRMISACADASHFVNCTGSVTVKDCVFESQMDDAVNVHGIYTVISDVNESGMYVRFMHYQQAGTPIYHAGDMLRFIKRDSMQPYGEANVAECIFINSTTAFIKINDFPKGVSPGDAVENISLIPDKVIIESCQTGKNRARSLLISTGKEVFIRENQLHSSGSAVYISGDANYWYESGPVGRVEISQNVISGCNSTQGWGRAAIDIVPEIPAVQSDYYHDSILIHDNRFLLYDNGIVFARDVRNLEIYGNTACYLEDANPLEETEMYVITSCGGPMPEPVTMVVPQSMCNTDKT